MVRHNNNCCEERTRIRNKLYELWLEEGNVGTPSDFLEWLKGEKGDPGLSNLNHEDTDSIKMEGTGSSEDPVKSFVNISKDPANSISIKTDGLFVDIPLIAVEAQTVPGITGLIPKSFKLPYFDYVRDALGVNKSIEYGFGAIDLSLHSADTDPTILLGALSFSAVDGAAIGYSSVSMGVSSKSIGDNSVTFGYKTEAIGSRSFAIGQSTSAVGHHSFAGGFMSKAVGSKSLAMGHNVIASGDNSIVFGYNSQTEGSNSIAGGYESFSKGDSSLAFGYRAKAEGLYSIALGVNTKALGVGTTALGEATTAVNRGSLVIGRYNSVGEEEVTEEWDPEGPAFEIGNGSVSSRSTSFTVHYNGNVKTKGNLEFLNPHDGFILKSPNGTRFKISIDNNGDFVTQQI